MITTTKAFQKNSLQKGASIIEYALVIAVIAAVAIVIESALGQKAFNLIQGSANALDEVSQQL
jgi:Flp pilus assembly pilin Flp